MRLCPVDLAACDRAGCRGGHCELAEGERTYTICWECGKVESHDIVHGICMECVRLQVTPVREEEA